MNHNISSFHTKFCKYPLSFKYNDFTTNFIENIIIISVVLPIWIYFGFSEESKFLMFGIGIPAIVLFKWLLDRSMRKNNLWKKLQKNLKEFYKLLTNKESALYTIDAIWEKIEQIRSLLEDIHRIKSKQSAYKRNISMSKFELLLQELPVAIVTILTDLRSDLATRLTEQQQILESAKTEVEHNITGTPELLAVSDTQKLRLDRQIEQFEELQRVLVRV